ncbi:MAG: flagellin, partial [Desulfococcaceae bacterium]
MAMSDISLTSGMRTNLLNLQSATNLLDRTQTRLSTGKKVNTALDNPTNFFAAQGHSNRASDLSARKDGMAEGIQTIKAADAGIKAITGLIEAAKGLAQSARSADATGREDLAAQFDALRGQIDDLAGDSGYKGINLLAKDSELTVEFDEEGDSKVLVEGFDASTGGDDAETDGLKIRAAETADLDGDPATDPPTTAWAQDSQIDQAVSDLNAALGTLRKESASLATNLSVINIRQDFTDEMIGTLQAGADNLTLADMNEEGANMLMLQTRQQLGTTALSLSAQAAQSV